jgi:AraC-like DNA-binding protein
MARPATVAGINVLDLLEALRSLGLGSRRLCQAAGLDLGAVRGADARVPIETMLRLFTEAERLAHDPLVGLHAGERVEPSGLIAYLVMSSPHLVEGLRQAVRFGRLPLDTLRITLDVRENTTSTVFQPGDRAFEASHHAIEYLLMVGLRAMRRAAGGDFRPREVHVRHAGRGTRAELERAFGCPVKFEQPDDRLVFRSGQLRTASRLANPRVAEQIEKFAVALVARVTPHATFRERVEDATRQLLATSRRAEIATVARQLGVSTRSLQRRLEDEHTTFRAVRDAVLWDVVGALLSNPLLKVEAVGLSVGFADAATFSRAFRRWARCSPAEYRRRLTRRPFPSSSTGARRPDGHKRPTSRTRRHASSRSSC